MFSTDCWSIPELQKALFVIVNFNRQLYKMNKHSKKASVKKKKIVNTGLPDNLKSGIENLSDLSMEDVKVHYNSAQPAQLNALAYAQGNDIHVAPEQEKHLPHEAWHVVQQKQGRVNPTKQMKEGNPVNDDAGLETAADKLGTKAIDFKYIPKKK